MMISSDGNMEDEVEARIESAVRMIGGMSEAVLRQKVLSKETKLKVMNATLLLTLVSDVKCRTYRGNKSQEPKPHGWGYCKELKE